MIRRNCRQECWGQTRSNWQKHFSWNIRFPTAPSFVISDADKCRAAAKISDLEILHEILLYAGGGRLVQLAAARRFEVIAPDEAKKHEDLINYLRCKF